MKKIIPIIVNTILVICGLIVLGVDFLAYFVTSTDEATGIMYDGLGRQLFQTPALLRLIFGQERLYPGFYWFLFDVALFFGLIGVAGLSGKIIEWIEKK